MLFTEPRFVAFFACLFVLYWSLKTNAARKGVLLVASYIFYGAWDWRFAVMLLILSSADYWFALSISRTSVHALRRRFVFCSVAMNLIVLGIFKYLNFFVSSTISAANMLHVQLDQPTLHIILPVGISFFTFQSLSYTIDVYRSEIPPARNLWDYLLFSSFFPQLVAGPIVRPKYFLPQLDSVRHIGPSDIRLALLLFSVGLAKKMAVADNISAYVDQVFGNPLSYDVHASITATWLYAVQIYCDFSGYSDMAIAVAALLGYRLTLNFDAPYLATSIQDFWRRWHISLSSWIRDYIYISLGGRSPNRLVTYKNLILTMLAGGLWHGASWTFVAWGGAHGAGQVAHQEVRRIRGEDASSTAAKIFFWFITLYFVCLCWILFRSSSFGIASLMIRRNLFIAGGGDLHLPTWLMGLPLGLLALQYVLRRFDVYYRVAHLNLPLYSLTLGAFGAVIVALLPFGYKPFIYFQF
jgi:alginate O-acetyltransferase complex protein AlgI